MRYMEIAPVKETNKRIQRVSKNVLVLVNLFRESLNRNIPNFDISIHSWMNIKKREEERCLET